MTFLVELRDDIGSRPPKLNDSYGHIQTEEEEGFLVGVADAGLGPHAVMI
jgi:hypothetical protein